jgi:hypothetical protein
MPSETKKQARTMAAAAHDPAFAAKMGIPQKVAHEFNQADKGGKLLSSAMKEESATHEKTESPAVESAEPAEEFNPARQHARARALRGGFARA